jgi:hypothetical protein
LIAIDSEKGRLPRGNFNRLNEILETGEITSGEIVEGFSAEKIAHTKNFLSLLFYFGLLTTKGVEAEEPVLHIPNETAWLLYYDYINEAYEETGKHYSLTPFLCLSPDFMHLTGNVIGKLTK